MKTNTITTIFLVGILAFSLAACSKSEAPTPKISERTEPPTPPKPQQPTLPPLDQEAVALAKKAFPEKWTQVGDSWFTLCHSEFIQMGGVTCNVSKEILSEADTLNGLQWKGRVKFSSRIYRIYGLDSSQVRQWSSWRDGGPFTSFRLSKLSLVPEYILEKTNGQWAIKQSWKSDLEEFTGSSKEQIESEFTKPSEEQIKKILPQ